MTTIDRKNASLPPARDWKHDRDTLQHELGMFTGTANYYRHSLNRGLVYTDGVKHLAERAAGGNGAYWLIDAVASHQRDIRKNTDELVVWRLVREKPDEECSGAVLMAADDFTESGEPRICMQEGARCYARQYLGFTDIGFGTLTLYMGLGYLCENPKPVDVLHLASER